MKRKLLTFFTLVVIFAAHAMAQSAAYLPKGSPAIDGQIDSIWNIAAVNYIEQSYVGESPTLGPSGFTYWQGMWDDKGIYILVVVDDDVFSPIANTDVTGDAYRYDFVELYFDVNPDLYDGLGPVSNQGHYQVAPYFDDYNLLDGQMQTRSDSVKWAVTLTDPTYIAEYFIPFEKLIDKDGFQVDKTGTIGFDVYVIDNDVTSGQNIRNRRSMGKYRFDRC